MRPPRRRRRAGRPRAAAVALGIACVAGLGAAGGSCAAGDAADARAATVGAATVAAPAAGGSAGGRRAGTGAAVRPPALADDDPAALVRAADLVRRARAYERRAVQAPAAAVSAPMPASTAVSAADSGAASPATAAGDVVRDPAAADSARRLYDAAAALVPDARDWLTLRRLTLEPATAERARLAAALATPAARDQRATAEATARFRTGDLAGAAAALDSAGRPASALAVRARLALAAPGGAASSEGVAVRAALLALLAVPPADSARPAAPPPRGESAAERARRAAVVLDSAFGAAAPLAAGERLAVARALADARDPGLRARAAAAFAAAFGGGVGTADDRLAYGRLLARAGRWRDAAAAFGQVPAGTAVAPVAAYERAHALLRARDGAGARAALRDVAARFGRDSSAASARFLLAELTADAGDETEARAEYLRLARELPEARLAPAAAVRAGVLALAAGDARAAAEAFDLGATGWPGAPEAGAARYWAGRAHAAAGDSATARTRWVAAADSNAESYYGWLASRRLGRAAWTPPAGAAVRRDPVADAAARRAALCEAIGLGTEAGWERDWILRWADTSAARQLAAAAAIVGTGRPGPGIRLALRAVDGGAERSADVWRLLYPLLYAGPLGREARAAGVDPALAAALVKQESNFTADAVSPVGARGLMQLMPDVARAIWRGPGAWNPALLFRPEVNIALGMRHLNAALRGWPHAAYALAAYNAGGSRVRRWERQPGASDPELFVERIPFAETRDYVRIVLRNREFYRGLYGL